MEMFGWLPPAFFITLPRINIRYIYTFLIYYFFGNISYLVFTSNLRNEVISIECQFPCAVSRTGFVSDT